MVKLSSLALSSDIIYLSHYATYRNMMMAAFFRFDVRHDGDDQYEYGEVRMFVGAESM